MDSPAQTDLFQVSAFDPPLRDNKDVMEYPFLAIQKGRRKPIEFTSPDGRVRVEIRGDDKFGIANIWDWDLMIYLSAQLNDGLELKAVPSPWIEFPPYDALRYMGKGTGGRQYRELAQTIRRLFSTSVFTTIRLDDTAGSEGGVRWIEEYKIPRKFAANEFLRNLDDGEPDGGRPWRVKLPDWIYNAILRRTGILAVHPDYFRLTGGLERWLYRLARKAVPTEGGSWNFRMETLHKRSGSTRPLRNFALDVRKIAEKNGLPEYGIHVHRKGKNEMVTLYRDQLKIGRVPRAVSIPEHLRIPHKGKGKGA